MVLKAADRKVGWSFAKWNDVPSTIDGNAGNVKHSCLAVVDINRLSPTVRVGKPGDPRLLEILRLALPVKNDLQLYVSSMDEHARPVVVIEIFGLR